MNKKLVLFKKPTKNYLLSGYIMLKCILEKKKKKKQDSAFF